MEKISEEKLTDIIEQIINAFLKNNTAGSIALHSIDYLDFGSRLYILSAIPFLGKELPDDQIQMVIHETGRLIQPHREKFEKNIPVKKLIETFTDKRSGMVGAAAKQLKERFMHLDYNDQKKVMSLFLDCSVSYRVWCYKTLKVWREPKYDKTLVAHWRKYHDKDCLDTIIEVLPGDVIKELYPEIRTLLNNYKYSLLLRRFGMEPWVEIDKQRLKKSSPHVYYYIRTMSFTHSPLSASECAELFYDYLQEAFSPLSEEELWKLNEMYEDENHNMPPLCYSFDGINLTSPNFSRLNVGDFLKLFAKMGHYDLVTGMCSWGESINRLLPYVTPINDNETDVEARKNLCKDRFLTYIRLLREYMPKNFEGISDTPPCDLSTIIKELEFERLQSNPAMSILSDGLDLAPF